MEVRLDLRLVEFALGLVGRKDLDPVGALGGLIGRDHDHAVGFGLLRGGPIGVEADDHFVSAVAEVLGLGVALAAVAQDAMVLPFSALGLHLFRKKL